MISQRDSPSYEFGPFRLDPAERLLLRGEEPVPLAPKVFDILLVLVRHSGRLLEKEELMSAVWPDQFVEEGNLPLNISTLRKALGERRYIETVPKRGYRFTAGVREVRTSPGDDHVAAEQTGEIRRGDVGQEREARAGTIEALAVLPLINVSADPKTEYLADGITESVINSLSQLPQLRVMARSTVFRYQGREVDAQAVGRELNVGAVLLGRVLQFDDQLIVRTELVDAMDGRQLWGGQYNRKPSDIFAVQEEIAREISEKLRLKLTSQDRQRLTKHHTESTEAYHAYLRGRHSWNKRTEECLKKAINYFRQAIDTDPCYALAYSGLADCYTLLGSAGYSALPPREAMSRAKAATAKALEIDDTLAEAHTSLAYSRFRLDWDWEGAEREFGRALELNYNYATAHHWYAILLSVLGRHDEALREIELALALDPLSLIISSAVGRVLHFAGRLDEAIQQYRKTLGMDPNYGEAHFNLGLTYERQGRHEEAITELQKAIDLSGNRAPMRAVLGYLCAMTGRAEEARATLEELKKLMERECASPMDVAIVQTGLGEKDEAIEWMQKACEERSGVLVFLKVEPLYDTLRADPKFTALLRRVGFIA